MVDAIYQLHSWRPARALETVSREDRMALYGIVQGAYDEGLTEAEMRRRATLAGAFAVRGRIAAGDDQTVVMAGHMLYAAMAKIEGVDDPLCARIGMGADLVQAAIVLNEEGFDAYGMVRDLVRETPLASIITYRPEASRHGYVPGYDAAVSCPAAMAPYVQALSFREQEAARALRGLMAPSGRNVPAAY